MREIVFRGKRIDNGEWIEGYITEHTMMPHDLQSYIGWVIECKETKLYDHNWYEVDPVTVGQYTGLKDKNGKRIFEGDIVEHHAQGDIVVNRGVVNWDVKNARWAHQLTTMNPDFTFFKPDAYEVIGNIHDNPEWLEVR